jgi:hypothetical protein
MNIKSFLLEPLQGKTSVSRVVWLYGGVGSLLYGAIELLLDPENAPVMALYAIGGFVFSVYVTLATYRCAHNCRSPWMARFVRWSAVVTLALLPVLLYLDLTGALTLPDVLGESIL